MVEKIVEMDSSPKMKDQNFIIVATFLPINKWRNVIPFLRLASSVEAQLKKSDGAVRYALKTDLSHKYFWTVSVWRDHSSMHAFIRAEPHLTAMAKFPKWAGDGAAFVHWESSSGKIVWSEVHEKLQSSNFHYGK